MAFIENLSSGLGKPYCKNKHFYLAFFEFQQQGIVDKEKNKLLEIEKRVNEIKKQIDKCPESMRGSMEEKLNKVVYNLNAASDSCRPGLLLKVNSRVRAFFWFIFNRSSVYTPCMPPYQRRSYHLVRIQ